MDAKALIFSNEESYVILEKLWSLERCSWPGLTIASQIYDYYTSFGNFASGFFDDLHSELKQIVCFRQSLETVGSVTDLNLLNEIIGVLKIAGYKVTDSSIVETSSINFGKPKQASS